MSKAREEYYNGDHGSCCEYAETYVNELEKQNSELIKLLCERCDYIGACELEEIPCAVKKYLTE